MNLSIGLMLGTIIALGAGAPPTAASLSYAQVDILGGGADIVVTGTNLLDATSVTVGGTVATITSTTLTTVSFQAPAKAAGVYDVVVVTPSGVTTLAASLEAWAPSTEAGCTLLCESPNYASAAGNGTWTTRVGTAPAQATTAPAATAGAPVFDGSHSLDAATIGTLMTMSGTPQGTFSVIINPAAPSGSSGTTNDPGLFADEVRGAIGASYSSAGFSMFGTDGTYKTASVAMGNGAPHVGIGRFKTGDSIQASVDGSAFAGVALGTYSAQATQVVGLGSNFNATHRYTGTMFAVAFHNTKVSDGYATKFYKWARQRHGVA